MNAGEASGENSKIRVVYPASSPIVNDHDGRRGEIAGRRGKGVHKQHRQEDAPAVGSVHFS